jgi:hypothetical protein
LANLAFESLLNRDAITNKASEKNTGNELVTQGVNVYQPEQWEAFRKFQTGEAYDPSILSRYFSEYVDPTYQKIIDARVNQARNTYGPSKSGYFSASTALAQQRAQNEVGTAQAAEKAKAALTWNEQMNQMRAAMLDKRPIEYMTYRPTTSITTPSISMPSGGGGGGGVGGSSYRGIGTGIGGYSGSGSSSVAPSYTPTQGDIYTNTDTENYGNWYDYYNTPLTNAATQSRLANYNYGDTSNDWFNNVYSNEEDWDPNSEATEWA